jgi:hypothetical protein
MLPTIQLPWLACENAVVVTEETFRFIITILLGVSDVGCLFSQIHQMVIHRQRPS